MKFNLKPNIIVIDTKTGRKRKFINQQDAEDFIEEHERPEDLHCEFDRGYVKRTLEKKK